MQTEIGDRHLWVVVATRIILELLGSSHPIKFNNKFYIII